MTDPSTPTDEPRGAAAPSRAYTRAAVDEYLNAIWLRRQALESEIAAARDRAARASRAATRLEALERKVGQLLVAAYAQHVAAMRRREEYGIPETPAATHAAPEAILDLNDADVDNNDPDDLEERPDRDELEDLDQLEGIDDLGDLDIFGIGTPDGFGDEFFGPSTAVARTTNGAAHSSGVRHG
jgi:hypothetical protein